MSGKVLAIEAVYSLYSHEYIGSIRGTKGYSKAWHTKNPDAAPDLRVRKARVDAGAQEPQCTNQVHEEFEYRQAADIDHVVAALKARD